MSLDKQVGLMIENLRIWYRDDKRPLFIAECVYTKTTISVVPTDYEIAAYKVDQNYKPIDIIYKKKK